jgi:riboflavin kinase/FMN adenylyltransferase
MNKIEKIEDILETELCAVALGAFDGVHLGHQSVIKAATRESRLKPTVFTFSEDPHGDSLLIDSVEKLELLESMGIQTLFIPSFEDIKAMPPKDFLEEILYKRCKAEKICCGSDFRFGKNAEGDVELLKEFCERRNIRLEIVPEVSQSGEKISSTAIRTALTEGNIQKANDMLGRRFGYGFEVIHGNHIGTGLGIPTVNQRMPRGFTLPKFGVYASVVTVQGRQYCGVTNIGVKPTVGSDYALSETWIQDFSGDVYGQRIKVELLYFIRPEKKFSSLEEMKEEIFRNSEQAKRIAMPVIEL